MAEFHVPSELRYTPTHEWLRVEGDVGVVGITAHAVEQLADIAYLNLPAAGRAVTRREAFGEVESVKAVAELFAPVSGTIVEVNLSLPDHLERLQQSPYDEGWMVKIQLRDPSEVAQLLSAEMYTAQLQLEEA